MNMNQIAAQLFTVRDFMKNKEEFQQTIKKLYDIGYRAVQISGLGFNNYKFIKETLDQYDMQVCATHIGYDRMQNDFDNVVKEHKYYNCAYVGLGMMPQEYMKDKASIKGFAKEFSELGRKFKDEGLNLIYHNHNLEFERFDEYKTAMDILFEETDPETVGFELDTFWVQAGGADSVKWIYKLDERMDVIHFKDMAIKESKQVMAEVGEGNLEWPAIIKACDDTNVKWAAVEQDICQRDPFESLKISYDNIYKMIEGNEVRK